MRGVMTWWRDDPLIKLSTENHVTMTREAECNYSCRTYISRCVFHAHQGVLVTTYKTPPKLPYLDAKYATGSTTTNRFSNRSKTEFLLFVHE